MAAKPRKQKLPDMEAHISSFQDGLRVYRNVRLIRVKSAKFNLLILRDYLPVLGEVIGTVCIVTDREEIVLHDIEGYFCHAHNSFRLLLREGSYVE